MPMIEYSCNSVQLVSGKPVPVAAKQGDCPPCAQNNAGEPLSHSAGCERTMAYKILRAHETNSESAIANHIPNCSLTQISDGSSDRSAADKMRLKFDALVSHDITYVGIIQTARASGMTEFPVPYALTNCHNSLCAVGGTINEDDHAFGLSAAIKYGGIFVPANHAVIHQYAREKLAGCGKMILGSDSHTRYGCYGTLGFGEGGGELVKQLLKNTYDISPPEVVLIWVEGSLPRGIGPHDVALALIKEVFPGGLVKDKILEFAGPGIGSLSMDFRIGVDVMTTETSCLSSIWETDDIVRAYYENVGRPEDYRKLSVEDGACYDSIVRVDLSAMESMIALPFHPSKAFSIHDLQREPERILREVQDECNKELSGQTKLDLLRFINGRGQIICEQGVIVGCAGGMYENISEAADILRGKSVGNGYFDLSVYPSSTPIALAMLRDGISETLIEAGSIIKPAFCGPCFGAGDTPAHNSLSIRHATRNFANREGSKPANGQTAAVALMDARSIAATAINGGVLTAATDIEYITTGRQYKYENSVYEKRCYNGYKRPDPSAELRLGPNITDWPKFPKMEDNMLLQLCAVIHDDVTTTDELIPSGETSSYRSNPVALSEFTLSRRAPGYVAASKAVLELEKIRREGKTPGHIAKIVEKAGIDLSKTSIGSCIFAKKPGDGSAREQAASCQKVLGGLADICYEYATKRYRSNCVNWGIIPFTINENEPFHYTVGDWIFIPGVRQVILSGAETFPSKAISGGAVYDIELTCRALSAQERLILAEGCLMNYYVSYVNQNT